MHNPRRILALLVLLLPGLPLLQPALPSDPRYVGAPMGVVPAQVATPIADYQFQSTYQSSVGTPPPLADIGPGINMFASETVDGAPRTVLRFPKGNGVVLAPTTGLIGESYTIVMRFRLEDVVGFRRVIDWKNGSAEAGLYISSGRLNFFPMGGASGPDVVEIPANS